MKSKTRKQRKSAPPRRPAPRRGPPRRGLLTLTAAMLLAAGGTWALFEYVIWNTTPAALVGTWVVVRPVDQAGSVFEFHRNGRLIGHIDPDGNHQILDARIRVEDNKIYATTRSRTTGEELTRVLAIQKLTGKRLVLKDEPGKVIVMEREE